MSLSTGVMAQAPDHSAKMRFVRDNKDKLPLVELGIAELPLARVHMMKAQTTPLEFGGLFYNGFRFDAPEWLDGDIVWLHSLIPLPGVPASKYSWGIIPEDPNRVFGSGLGFTNWDISDKFPLAKRAFPGSTKFIQQVFYRKSLKPGWRYIVWFSFADKLRTEARFAMTVNSDKGIAEWGVLPTAPCSRGPNANRKEGIPPTAKDPRESGREAVEIFRKSGAAKAEAFLDSELENFIRTGARYWEFHFHIWKAVQDGEIRRNLEWGAFGFDWLQRTALRFGATIYAEELCHNTSTSFMSVRKPGAARLALEPFYKGMADRALPLDPFELEDSGPFLNELSMIRRRALPVAETTRAFVIGAAGYVGLAPGLPKQAASSLKAIAHLEASGGDWKRSIERNLWVRALAEDPGQFMSEREDVWYSATYSIAETLHSAGLGESALTVIDEFQANKAKERYLNRNHQLIRQLALKIRIDHGQADDSLIAQLDDLYREISGNPNLHKHQWERVLVTKAKCLAALGQHAEADELLTRLVDEEDNEDSRVERIALRIFMGKLNGIENELLAALSNRRKWGLKMDEVRLYALYADFLEKSGRIDEAIAARREAIRLQRSFDLFALLPVELAKLSAMLRRCGDERGAEVASSEATKLAAASYMPERVSKQSRTILADKVVAGTAVEDEATTSLQPSEALVIPIDGKPICGRMTISNLGHRRVDGRVSFSGMPVTASWDGVTLTAVIGKAGPSALNVSVDPGSYVMIALESGVPSPQGCLSVTWIVAGQSDQSSIWTFEPGETDVSAAVIDAGVYKRNAFFGIPVFHHYQHASTDAKNASLRVVATPGCRVEVYDIANRPISIDVNGDGEFTGEGEDYYHDPDADGRADLPLENGSGVILIHVFPPSDIPANGLKLQLQSWTGNEWAVVAESRIEP